MDFWATLANDDVEEVRRRLAAHIATMNVNEGVFILRNMRDERIEYDSNPMFLVHIAAASWAPNIIGYLIDIGIAPDAPDDFWKFPIEWAIRDDDDKYAHRPEYLRRDAAFKLLTRNSPMEDSQSKIVSEIMRRYLWHLRECRKDFSSEEFAQYIPVRYLMVNAAHINAADLQPALDKKDVPITLTDDKNAKLFNLTLDQQSPTLCTFRIEDGLGFLSGKTMVGKLEKRYGYWIYTILESMDH